MQEDDDEQESDKTKTAIVNEETIKERLKMEILAEQAAEKAEKRVPQQPQQQLTDQQLESIIKSEQFSSFISTSSRLVERALISEEKFDIFRDYAAADSPTDNGYVIN
jgi:hypothetical protein